MESYGVSAPIRDDDDAGWDDARHALIAAIPPEHLRLLRGMELYLIKQNLLFVHAGIRPGIALNQQSREDLLGIRSDFLDSTQPYLHFIVHGHTPVEQPDLRPNRLNLDTGAYMTGRLSAARFEGVFSAFLAAKAPADTPSPT
jgi:serine/threonine protein phosphatase 1